MDPSASDPETASARLDRQMALPPLREDLGLHTGPEQKNGAPSWVIEDPLRGRFYRIGWMEFELLQRWAFGDARTLAQQVAHETLLAPAIEEVLQIGRAHV